MKKSIKILMFLAFVQTSLFAQITIDSVHFFQGSNGILDSVYIEIVSTGPVFKNIIFGAPLNDACGTRKIGIIYAGCDTIPSVHSQMIQTGFMGDRTIVFAIWDTLLGCTSPQSPTITDQKTWDKCFPASLNEIGDQLELSISPNPTRNTFQITSVEPINFKSIQLFSVNGKLVKQFNAQERSLNVRDFETGIYFLQFETDQGRITKKVVVQY